MLSEKVCKNDKPEATRKFINYAHRGASAYAPENTALAFHYGIMQGANGIETDVQMTKDGIPVLFHDNTIERMTNEDGAIGDYTYKQLQSFKVTKYGMFDRIMKLEDFFYEFGWRDLTFAIELKGAGTEESVAKLIRKYKLESKCVITSFKREYLAKIHELAPELELGFLTSKCDDSLMEELRAEGIGEFCPHAASLTPEMVDNWHKNGFRVRAWGVGNSELMRNAVEAGADGMTVNFPDRLKAYLEERESK